MKLGAQFIGVAVVAVALTQSACSDRALERMREVPGNAPTVQLVPSPNCTAGVRCLEQSPSPHYQHLSLTGGGHLGCRYYPARNGLKVVITVTAGSTPVQGSVSRFKLGGTLKPGAATPMGWTPRMGWNSKSNVVSITIEGSTLFGPIKVAPGHTQQLGPFYIPPVGPPGGTSLSKSIVPGSCTVLSYQ
jgi:hypothetical protein